MSWNGPVTGNFRERLAAAQARLNEPPPPPVVQKAEPGQIHPATDLIVELEKAGLPRHAARIIGPKIVELEKRLAALENLPRC